MLNLYENKYDRKTLKTNIYAVKLLDILKTQTIDASFAAKYILNDKYQLHPEDKVTILTVLQYQPHITYDAIQKELLSYDSDNDSIDDFESVSR